MRTYIWTKMKHINRRMKREGMERLCRRGNHRWRMAMRDSRTMTQIWVITRQINGRKREGTRRLYGRRKGIRRLCRRANLGRWKMAMRDSKTRIQIWAIAKQINRGKRGIGSRKGKSLEI